MPLSRWATGRARSLQFTYFGRAANSEIAAGRGPRKASERIWMNLPPARVWVYRKR